ncbi:transcription factor HES-5-like isoform X1 [Strix aluco]|uniref:transcription factor HES-5-like isoform X1 n=1 Tax=Strix aluco TaxID=111821 RepID=UPI003DA55DCF
MAPSNTLLIHMEEKLLPKEKNKLRKPVVEKMRRDRINSSIEQLKLLLEKEFQRHQPNSKLEKADILEVAVSYLKQQSQLQDQSECRACIAHHLQPAPAGLCPPIQPRPLRNTGAITHWVSPHEQGSWAQALERNLTHELPLSHVLVMILTHCICLFLSFPAFIHKNLEQDFNSGYLRCLREAMHFLSYYEPKKETQVQLIKHFCKAQMGADAMYSPALRSSPLSPCLFARKQPAQKTVAAAPTIWRPW